MKFKTVLISDIHLGSPLCQAESLLTFLKNLDTDILILNGDIFDDLNLKRLTKDHFAVLKQLRKMSGNSTHVVWIKGNHDDLPSNLMSLIFGVDIVNFYKWEDNGKTLYATHGDIWDVYIYKHKVLTHLVTGIFNFITSFDSQFIFKLMRWIKSYFKEYSRNVESIRISALEFAKTHDYKAIFCGHTHHAELVEDNDLNIYGNDGTWQTDVPHFIGLHDHFISLYKYENTVITEELNIKY